MRKLLCSALAVLLGLTFLYFDSGVAHAQSVQRICVPTAGTNGGAPSCQDVTSSNPFPVNASVSASISGFAPASTGTPISVTTGGVTGSLPAGAVVAAFNTGATNTAYCKLGASATTSDIAIPPQSWFAFTVGVATQMTCITSTSTTTINMVGGSGLPTGAGGGGGGGGSSGAVFGPTANGSPAANPPVLMGGTANGTATGNVANATILAGNSATTTMPSVVVADPNVLAAINGPIAAGTNLIGKVGIDQTTPGTTNNVAVSYGAAAVVDNPCQTVAKNFTPISITTAVTTRIITPTSAKKTYVCSIVLQAAGADNVGVVEGTGGTCGTGTAGILGGTTAASGLNLSANEGWSGGNGQAPVLATAGTNVDFCLITSAATNLAGHVTWVQK